MTPGPEHPVPVEYQDSTQQPDDPDRPGGPAVREEPERPPADWAEDDQEGDGAGQREGAQSGEGNLLQLPDGATFGREGEPSAQEREELLRHAGGVQQEMREESLAEDEDD